MALHAFLVQTALHRIWVSRSVVHAMLPSFMVVSWAVFQVIGANPKVKSKTVSIGALPIVLLITYSHVSMVPGHDLPVEI